MSGTAARRTALRELAVGRPPERRAGIVPRSVTPQKSDAIMTHVDVENKDGSGKINGVIDGGNMKMAAVNNGGTCKQPEGSEEGAKNEVPAGPPAVEFEYIQSEDLQDVPNPEECVSTLLQRLDSKDWVVISEALNNVRQLAIYRKQDISSILDKIVGSIIKSIKNPRSALCKTAIMATADLFRCFGDEMAVHVDSLLLQLLLKASQDKRFVCEEAEKTLFVMIESLAPAAILEKLISYAAHRNPRVRAKATVCVHNSAARLDPVGIMQFGLPTLLRVAGAQIIDQLPEARDSGRKLAVVLHAAHRDCLNCECAPKAWEDMCTDHLPPNTAHTIIRLTGAVEASVSPSGTREDVPANNGVSSSPKASLGKVSAQEGTQNCPVIAAPSANRDAYLESFLQRAPAAS
ncbi:hypothetical protein CBR_g38394 [Chara braunii]|uniref:TOG domain-containing protein n=1 Tax=Chara braunii TaxID=69332 RepID=A0A388JNH1_CHABU|nr:hypothetical protein CBR_g38394 [Chara braunii]|eukprot:GBG59366.1 hypothetical protein CBR_g38394 [Chara braunii]